MLDWNWKYQHELIFNNMYTDTYRNKNICMYMHGNYIPNFQLSVEKHKWHPTAMRISSPQTLVSKHYVSTKEKYDFMVKWFILGLEQKKLKMSLERLEPQIKNASKKMGTC